MTLRIPAKVLIQVWSYNFYDMTLSTGKQRRHMIKRLISAEAVLTNTHNLGAKVRKIGIPLYTPVLLYKDGG